MRHRKVNGDVEDLLEGALGLELVENSPAPEDPLELSARISDRLLDAGFGFEQAERAAAIVEPLVCDEANRRAGEALRFLLRSLPPNSTTAVALQAVVLGDEGSVRGLAEQNGVPHSSLQVQVDTLEECIKRQLVGHPSLL
jgi:hypothetical protein